MLIEMLCIVLLPQNLLFWSGFLGTSLMQILLILMTITVATQSLQWKLHPRVLLMGINLPNLDTVLLISRNLLD